jgi:DTW domain-containing protein
VSRRDHRERRCDTCKLHRALCICALIPRLETRTRLILVIHREEERKPTNTGGLAARALIDASVVVTGDRARALPDTWFAPDEQPVLLFPAEDARPIDEVVTGEHRPVLVVPDGTWRQAQKMGTRIEALRGVPRVSLPAGAPTTYQLRKETKDAGLATLEAIARALRVLEGPARGPVVEEALLSVFRTLVDRTLWTRGALRDDQVHGGIPEAARVGVRG